MVLGESGSHPHALSNGDFEGLFGVDTPVVINYHGYPAQVKALLFERNHHIGHKRIEILGYVSDSLPAGLRHATQSSLYLILTDRSKKARRPRHG